MPTPPTPGMSVAETPPAIRFLNLGQQPLRTNIGKAGR